MTNASNVYPVCIVHNSTRTLLIFRREYIESLLGRGHKVHCISPIDDELAAQTLTELGVTMAPIPAGSLITSALAMSYHHQRLYRKTNGQLRTVCHFLTTIVMAYPSLIFTRRNNLLVIEGLGSFLNSKTYLQRIFRVMLKVAASRCLFMNSYEKSRIGSSGDIVLNGIGIPLEKFSHVLPSSAAKKSGLNLLYVGRLIADKGIHDVIEVFDALFQKDDSCKLHLVGDVYPNNPSSLNESQIEEIQHRFGTSVVFHGFQRNIVDHYQQSDVLLLLSKHEGYPVVIMEANACGIPVVAYDVPGCRDAISPGVNGVLVNYRDNQAVVDVLTDIDLTYFQDRCITYAKENFDRSEKNEKILAAIDNL